MNHLRYLWNYFLSEHSYHRRRVLVPNRPFVFSIETTSVCNLKCVMCPYKDMTRDHEMMDFEIFTKVIDEVRSYNGLIWLHNLGEPLAHPQFAEMITYTKQQGLKCGISTNATLLDANRGRKLLESGLDKIILCMDGITQETYERLRAGANFEKVTENIENFLKQKAARGFKKPRTIVQLIFMKETEPQLREFNQRWGRLADRVHAKPFCTWAEQVETIVPLSEAKHWHSPGPTASGGRHPCAYLWRNLVVTAHGDVIPCCIDYDARMIMGNVRENTLREIWNGEKYRQARADHLAGRYLSVCESCNEWVGAPASRTYPCSKASLVKIGSLAKKAWRREGY